MLLRKYIANYKFPPKLLHYIFIKKLNLYEYYSSFS